MGKIFGISDLPVSTIMSPFSPIKVAKSSFESGVKQQFGNIRRVDVRVPNKPILKNSNCSSIKNKGDKRSV